MKKWGIGLLVLAVLGVGSFAPYFINGTSGTLSGLSVDGAAVSGMSREALVRMLSEKRAKLAETKLPLEYKTVKETWLYRELGVTFDAEKEADRILALGRSGNIFVDLKEQWHVLLSGGNVQIALTVDEGKIQAKVADLAKRYEGEAEEPKPTIADDGTVTFLPGRPFLKIDAEKLKQAVKAYVTEEKTGVLPIPVTEEKLSQLTQEQLQAINRVLGVFTTYFGPDENRSANIAHAAAALEGKMLAPGEAFSFNQTTGLRSYENGYLEAPVFLNGKLVPDAGGGVCQVSSTLFGAVLRAGLSVTDRSCHFAPVAYVPIGQDATVADQAIDFCFQNQLTKPIYLHTVYAPGEVTVYVLGNAADVPSDVAIWEASCHVLPRGKTERIDATQAKAVSIEEGHDGYEVLVARHVAWADGRVQNDSFSSVYDPVNDIYTYKEDPKKKAAEKKAQEKVSKKSGKETLPADGKNSVEAKTGGVSKQGAPLPDSAKAEASASKKAETPVEMNLPKKKQ